MPYTFIPKFVQMLYTVTGANMAAGAILAAVMKDRQAQAPGPGGVYQSSYSTMYC
jgi:hypothetical protein